MDLKALNNILDPLQSMWDNLSERERKLVMLMGAIFAAIVLVLPAFLAHRFVSEMSTENQAIRDALRNMELHAPELAEKRALRMAAERRYTQKPPALGSFIEEKAKQSGLQLGSVTDEADRNVGSYLKKSTRVHLDNVNLRALVDLMAAVENSGFAIAIDFLRIEHFRSGDSYNVELGVTSYEKGATPAAGDSEEGGNE